MLQFMGSQRVGHDWATELNWTEPCYRALPTQVEFWVRENIIDFPGKLKPINFNWNFRKITIGS